MLKFSETISNFWISLWSIFAGNILNMDSSCVGGNVSPSDMSGSSSHTSPQPPGCQMDDHLTGNNGGGK